MKLGASRQLQPFFFLSPAQFKYDEIQLTQFNRYFSNKWILRPFFYSIFSRFAERQLIDIRFFYGNDERYLSFSFSFDLRQPENFVVRWPEHFSIKLQPANRRTNHFVSPSTEPAAEKKNEILFDRDFGHLRLAGCFIVQLLSKKRKK